jgi:hypothetical protein
MLMWMDYKYFHTCYMANLSSEQILNLATDENALGFLPIVTNSFRFSANCNQTL